MDPVKVIEYKGYKIKIFSDETAQNPRTSYDNLGKIVTFDRRVSVEKQEYSSPQEFMDYLNAHKEDMAVIKPLFLYDHSGLALSTGRFACDGGGWDTSHIGFIYVTKETARKEFGRLTKKQMAIIESNIDGEVETFHQYISGDCYGYQVENPDGEDIADGSCWGFYGYDNEKSGLLEQAQNAIDCEITRVLKEEGVQEKMALV